ncbi:hypothetical protein K8I28_17610 [bacterium]|nr:hypothetical protein [bacterium]
MKSRNNSEIFKTVSFKYSTAILFALLSLFMFSCKTTPVDPEERRTIAVYNGYGVWDTSAVAVRNCLVAAGWTVRFVDEGQIQQSLDGYGSIVIPGGNPLDMLSVLGYTGKANIKNLVETGGGYIGLGGGAYLASDSIHYRQSTPVDSSLALFRGAAVGPISQISPTGYTITLLNLDLRYLNPEGVATLNTLYYGGPRMYIQYPGDYITLARFNSLVDSTGAAYLFEYGLGRVALTSCQPEIEENDLRDGSEWGSDLTDGDSEWLWLQYMAEYVMHQRNE